jgi:MFS family permease
VRASDRRRLYAAAFLRATATGLLGVLLGLDLAARGFDPTETGLVLASGLAGAAVAVLVATVAGARWGERRLLAAITLAGGAGALLASTAAHPWLVVAAAFVGGVNGVGRDRGAQLVLEQALLPATTTDAGRTRAFAWYNLLQDAGHALGALGAGVAAGRSLDGYAVLLLASGLCYVGLAPQHVVPRPPETPAATAGDGRRALRRLSALFLVDSFAGGFVPGALLAVFFERRFGVGAPALGVLFFAARIANAGSHLAAAWLARRIGLVRTMVFTHVPSSLLLLTVAYAPTFRLAAALFLLREGLVEMDVPTRQSYVMAVVPPAERTRASGVTHLVRLAGWGAGSLVAGATMQHAGAAVPLGIAAALKLAYDALLYRAFRRERPPEERA